MTEKVKRKHEELSRYEGYIRPRVGGLLFVNDHLLLVQQQSMFDQDRFHWLPPGGGVAFGEPLHRAVCREFHEETGLLVKAGRLLYLNEFIYEKVHAVEFYFEVRLDGGGQQMRLGTDPELPGHQQIIRDLKWHPVHSIQSLDFIPRLAGLRLEDDYRAGFPTNPVLLQKS
ncbi:MAG: NUDIX domain-containing protein [Bacteroidetes bacterium]|nr:NUDIX domain-containing protein [Bacteroidota bacterium]